MEIKGDMGARNIVEENMHDMLLVEIDDPDAFIDIDTVEDLNSLE